MNKRIHRLVFDRRRGMRVPAAEHARSAGKAAGGQARAVALVCAALVGASLDLPVAEARSLANVVGRSGAAWAGRTNPTESLPVRSATRPDVGTFVYNREDPVRLVITQTAQRGIINWDSFNIGAGYTVEFRQPDKGSVLNKIWDLKPSIILGKIQANGEVILENQNGGFIFGGGARVETARFVATALSLANDTFMKGLRITDASGELDSFRVFGGDADTASYQDEDGQQRIKSISIERGAEIKALAGGDVLMVAPAIFNDGRIETPSGQTVLAAGQKVYLLSTSKDQTQRGLVVAVDAFKDNPDQPLPEGANVVEHVNTVVAEKGSINLVGMVVRQNGVLTATTAVKGRNGVITLEAGKSAAKLGQIFKGVDATTGQDLHSVEIIGPTSQDLGSVEFGAGSVTQILPSADLTDTQYDADVFIKSRIKVIGADVLVRGGARIEAKAGNIELFAGEKTTSGDGGLQTFMLGNMNTQPLADNSRLVIERGAVIDASGVRDVALPMSRHQITARLFKNELADQPVQRGGVLYRQEVSFDARQFISIANVKGFYEGIQRSALEWSTLGGNVTIAGIGSVAVQDGAVVDVSGGSVRYGDGILQTSQLRKGQQVVSLGEAAAGERYDELLPLSTESGRRTPGYVQGFDAGGIVVSSQKALAMGISGFRGDVVVGPLQRASVQAGAYTRDRATSRAIGRPSILQDKPYLYSALRPVGGSLTVGLMLGVNTLRPGLDRIELLPGNGSAPLASGAQLGVGAWGATGLASLQLNALQVDVQPGVDLRLGASGSLGISAVDGIRMAGQVTAPGGQVNLVAEEGDIVLAPQARIDLSGHEVDEHRGGAGPAALSVDGGVFTASAGQSLLLQEGSSVDVSAGVWRQTGGDVRLGQAGAVDLTLNQDPRGQTREYDGLLQLAGTLRAFGFDGGGSLSLDGLRTITLDDTLVTGSEATAHWRLGSAFLSAHGFSAFDLKAAGDVTVAAGQTIAPQLQNLATNFTSRRRGEAADSAALTRVATLQAGQRTALDISLAATAGPAFSLARPIDGLDRAGDVRVQAGARLDAGMGGRLSLSAAGSIEVSGTLQAQGGEVALAILGARGDVAGTEPALSPDKAGYLKDQFIALRSGGRIDVSGVAKTYMSDDGRVLGDVLGGGQVTFNKPGRANRGQILVEAGSEINADGAVGTVALSGGRHQVSLSRDAGSIGLWSSDGFKLGGKLSAQAKDARASGGQFTASLSREGLGDVFDKPTYGGQDYPTAERTLTLLADGIGLGAPAYGAGVLSAATLRDGGFDRIRLRSEERLVLGAGVGLHAAGDKPVLSSVVLSAPVLEAAATTDPGLAVRTIKAAHVALGDVDNPAPSGATAPAQPQALAGTATLDVKAGLIEVHGHSALRGFKQATLAATLATDGREDARRDGEVRLIGRALNAGANTLQGRLAFGGHLTLQAGQVYASTLSNFTVAGIPGASTLSVLMPKEGSTSQTPLSALGRLTLTARDITIGGVLRQPFGSITVEAEAKPELLDGSELSVTGQGVKVPVGSTVNQAQWVYATQGLAPGQAAGLDDPGVLKLNGQSLDKGILVKGRGLVIHSASAMNAQAGGDLVAWEFLSGVGGTRDTLARQGVYAILPGYSYDFAPYDTEILASQTRAGSSLRPGAQISITTPNGVLGPGTYTLLPARYAVLPGAVLVSEVSLGDGATMRQAAAQDNGSVVVSGFQTLPGRTGTAGDPRVRLLLEPEDTFRAQSDLSITDVSRLLRERALKEGQPLPTMPGDAGRVSLAATDEAFAWAARYNLAGGQFDLAMKDLRVVSQAQADEITQAVKAHQMPASAAHVVVAEQLASTQAASILLGGTRTGTADNATVNVTAQDVKVDSGVQADELWLVAGKTLSVADGVALQSRAGSVDDGRANTFKILGKGVVLGVSHRADTSVRRDLNGEAPGGDGVLLSLGSSVVLRGQAVQLDSTSQMARGNDLTINAPTLGLGAQRLSIGGEGTGDEGALNLAADVFTRQRVELRSYSALDIHGTHTIGALDAQGQPLLASLTLDTPVLRGLGTSDDTVKLRAGQLALRNSSGILPKDTVDSATRGGSNLVVETRPAVRDATAEGITLGAGTQRLAFANATLDTTGDIVFRGDGTLEAQQDLTLSAARVTAATGAGKTVVADKGKLTVRRHDDKDARTMGDVVGSGASLTLQARTIEQAGYIDLASGTVTLRGKGSGQSDDVAVLFAKGSTTRAAGWEAQSGGKTVAVAPGGTIEAMAETGLIEVAGTLDVSVPDASKVSKVGVAAGQIRLEATQAYKAATQTTPAVPGGGVVLADSAVLKGRAGTDKVVDQALSGRFTLYATRLMKRQASDQKLVDGGKLDALASLLTAGGMQRELDLRVRHGDVSLDSTLEAGRVLISADAGTLTLNSQAHIDTSQAAGRGGVVQLASSGNLSLNSGARITATATQAGANGGDVLLSSGGKITLAQGSGITAGALDGNKPATQGRVVLRAGLATPQGTVKNFDSVNAKVEGAVHAGEVILEGVKRYDKGSADVILNAAQRTAFNTDADKFTAQAAKVLRDTGLNTVANARTRLGVELVTMGAITLDTDWNLYRAGKTPLNVTLRAGKSLTLNGSMSDGFVTATRSTSTTPSVFGTGDAGSFRLVAGADLGAADPMRTSKGVAADLTIAGNKMVRTANGSIEMAAAQDIVLQPGVAGSNPANTVSQAVVYVAGRPSDDPAGDTSSGTANRSAWQRFTRQGGRLEVRAGRDITAPVATQGFGNWFLHTGNRATTVAWASDFDAFRQGLGSMGGGDIHVTAGRNIVNLGVAAPTSARTIAKDGASVQVVENGGDVLVRAGGDVQGGMFFLGRGFGHIEAGGSLTTGGAIPGKYSALAPVLGLMDGQWLLQAGGDLALSAVYNPTMLDAVSKSGQKVSAQTGGSYLTYGNAAAVSLSSAAGDVAWLGDSLSGTDNKSVLALLQLHSAFSPANEALRIANNNADARIAVNTAPPTLEAAAFGGSFTWSASVDPLLLAPSPEGDLRLYAQEDIRFQGGQTLAMLDLNMRPATGNVQGSVSLPVRATGSGSVNLESRISTATNGARDGIHAADIRRAAIHALGDISFGDAARLVLPKTLEMVAGSDLLAPSVVVEHQHASDISRLVAGGNILGYTNTPSPERPFGLIRLAGPGEMWVEAGRTLDLSSSAGIEATGAGARLRVSAGMAPDIDVDALATTFMAGPGQAGARQALIAYVEKMLHVEGLDDAQALAYFRAMTPAHQAAFAERELVLPGFAARFVQGTEQGDVVWAWVARSAGIDPANLGSALHADYQKARQSLVNYVADAVGQAAGSLGFDQALALYRTRLTAGERAAFIDKRRIDPRIAGALLAAQSMEGYARDWQALVAAQPAGANRVSAADHESELFKGFMRDVLMQEIQRTGSAAAAVADSANPLFNPRRQAVREALWDEVRGITTLAGLGAGFGFAGDLDLSGSKIHTLGQGSLSRGGIDLMAPGGQVLVGTATATEIDRQQATIRGLATYGGGSVRSFSSGDFQVASQKVHIVGSGHMVLSSSEGDIDSGRGSNTAVALPPKQPVDDGYGTVNWLSGKTTVGSGMSIFVNDQGVREGRISLLAPRGEVRALDAYIDAPEIDVAGPFLGEGNLKGDVSGVASTPTVSVSLGLNSGLGAETAAGQAQEAIARTQDKARDRSSLLTVDLLGMGDDAPGAGMPVAEPAPASSARNRAPVQAERPDRPAGAARDCRPGQVRCP